MKLKDVFIVPMLGLGYFDDVIVQPETTFKVRTVMILFFKLQFYKIV